MYIGILLQYKNNVMNMIVLEHLDCLKGNLKKMLLSRYQSLHLTIVLLRIEQLIKIAKSNLKESIFLCNHEILRDLSFAIKIRCVICKYSLVENSS